MKKFVLYKTTLKECPTGKGVTNFDQYVSIVGVSDVVSAAETVRDNAILDIVKSEPGVQVNGNILTKVDCSKNGQLVFTMVEFRIEEAVEIE